MMTAKDYTCLRENLSNAWLHRGQGKCGAMRAEGRVTAMICTKPIGHEDFHAHDTAPAIGERAWHTLEEVTSMAQRAVQRNPDGTWNISEEEAARIAERSR